MAVNRNAVWASAGVLSESEIAALRVRGWNLTTWSYPIDPNDRSADLDTVRLHHPGQVIWVEAVAG